MKVFYHISPGFQDVAMEKIKVISTLCELYVFFEVTPGTWKNNQLDLPYNFNKYGVNYGEELLKKELPFGAFKYFQNVKKIHFLVYPSKISLSSLKCIFGFKKLLKTIKPMYVIFEGESVRSLLLLGIIKTETILNLHEPTLPENTILWSLWLTKKLFIRYSTIILLHSNEAEKIFKKYNSNKNVYKAQLGLYNIFRSWSNSTQTSEEGYVLFLGYITKRKGADILYSVAEELSNTIKNFKIIFAGKLTEDIIGVSKKLGQNGYIKILNKHVNNTELNNLVKNSKFLVLPYRQARQSGVILTAYSFDKPVICSKIPGLCDQVITEKTGLLVKPNDRTELLKAIDKLYTNDDLCLSMENEIKEAKESKFGWNEYKDIMNKIFEKHVN